jgi:hypothetical protein
MAEATATVELGYLAIFAAFFVGASEAETHYYSIKQLHEDILSLQDCSVYLKTTSRHC